jgi:hypothetical protein
MDVGLIGRLCCGALPDAANPKGVFVTTYSRRQALQVLGLATLSVPLVRALPARATDDGQSIQTAWRLVGTQPIVAAPRVTSIGGGTDVESQFEEHTVLPMRALTGNASDPAWVLWAWHHDSVSPPHFHAWTAPAITGPWDTAPRTINRPTTDVVYDAAGITASGYDQNHFSCGDIAWDPLGRRFVSTPHFVRRSVDPLNNEPCQDSFLMESTDGFTWSWLGGWNQPRLVCGPPANSADSVHTGYGRLLRDLDGTLAQNGGKYWWIYRAQRNDRNLFGQPRPKNPQTGQPIGAGTLYRPALASATSLDQQTWSKDGTLFTTSTANTGQFAMSSFVQANGTPSLYYVMGNLVGPPSVDMFTTSTDGTTNLAVPGTVVPFAGPDTATSFITSGASIIRDPDTHQLYAVHLTLRIMPDKTLQAQFWLYESVVN